MRQRKIAMGFTERRAFTADIAGAARALSADGDADKGDDGGAWGGERDGGSAANSGHSGLQKYASTGGIFAASAPAALRGQGAGKDVSEPYSATRPGTSGSAGDVESLRAYTTGKGESDPWGEDDEGKGGQGLEATAPLFQAPEPRARPLHKSLRLAQSTAPAAAAAGSGNGASGASGTSGTSGTQRGRRPRPVQLMTIDADQIPGLAKTRPPPLPAAQRPIVFPPVITKYQHKQL